MVSPTHVFRQSFWAIFGAMQWPTIRDQPVTTSCLALNFRIPDPNRNAPRRRIYPNGRKDREGMPHLPLREEKFEQEPAETVLSCPAIMRPAPTSIISAAFCSKSLRASVQSTVSRRIVSIMRPRTDTSVTATMLSPLLSSPRSLRRSMALSTLSEGSSSNFNGNG